MSTWSSLPDASVDHPDVDVATEASWSNKIRLSVAEEDTRGADIELTPAQVRGLIAKLTRALAEAVKVYPEEKP